MDLSREVFLSEVLLPLLPSPWSPVKHRAGQRRIRLEEWSGCAAIEARSHRQVDCMKFWRSLVQAPPQSRTTLVQVSCGFACLSLEKRQGQRCRDLSGQHSAILPTVKHSPTRSFQACHPCNYPSGSCWPLLDHPLDSFWSSWTRSSPLVSPSSSLSSFPLQPGGPKNRPSNPIPSRGG